MVLNGTKGQGLSLTTIIVAAIALIVLVVLVMIFTGRIGFFDEGVGEAGSAELVKMKLAYGDCHPTPTAESNFREAMGKAETDADKELARNTLTSEIERCDAYTEKDSCTVSCSWK